MTGLYMKWNAGLKWIKKDSFGCLCLEVHVPIPNRFKLFLVHYWKTYEFPTEISAQNANKFFCHTQTIKI